MSAEKPRNRCFSTSGRDRAYRQIHALSDRQQHWPGSFSKKNGWIATPPPLNLTIRVDAINTPWESPEDDSLRRHGAMMMKAVFTALVVTVVAITASVEGTPGGPASLGIVDMKGGSKCVEFVASAVGTAADVDLKGKLKNNTGLKVNDVKIAILPKTPAGSDTPIIKGATVNGQSTTGTNTSTTITVSLNGEHLIQDEGKVDVTVDLGDGATSEPPNPAIEWKICFTPSCPKGSNLSLHYDMVGENAFTSASGSASSTLETPGNAGIVCWVKNIDEDSNKTISKIDVEFTFPSGDSITLSSGSLQDTAVEPVSSTTTVSGNKITFTDFDAIHQNNRYAVFVELSTAPTGATEIKVTATY